MKKYVGLCIPSIPIFGPQYWFLVGVRFKTITIVSITGIYLQERRHQPEINELIFQLQSLIIKNPCQNKTKGHCLYGSTQLTLIHFFVQNYSSSKLFYLNKTIL
ncbi:hypothetical protein Hanom_Chr02g00177871 [Helianthus anomalus]